MSDTPQPPDTPPSPAHAGGPPAMSPVGPEPTADPSGLGERIDGAYAAVSDGLQVLGRLLASAGWVATGALLALSLAGIVALAIGLAVWHANLVQVAVILVLVAPCIVAPLVLRHRIAALLETATHPAEAAVQARDLLGTIRSGGDLRREVDRLRTVVADSDRRRVRRAFDVARATSGVLGMVEPDPQRHPLLMPLRPERLARLSAWASACLWGPPLAGLVTAAALVTAVVRAVA